MSKEPARKFGLLSYPGISENLGDEIQSLAARAFLPSVDHLIARESISDDPGQDLTAILNGWFTHDPRAWPPHPRIRPLLISMHLDQSPRRRLRWPLPSIGQLLTRRHGAAFFKAHGPVGARDAATHALFAAAGIEAYRSGCLTLTLPPSVQDRSEAVIASDLEAPVLIELERRLGRKAAVTTHVERQITDPQARLRQAESLLDRYARAELVVTQRLHCALPCLAYGTPVLFIAPSKPAPRLEPAISLAVHVARDDFLAGTDDWNPARPPPNPTLHHRFADDLRRRCEDFLGR